MGESLTVAWTEPFLQIYTNIFKILKNIWSDFKNICSKLTRPELGKGVKVPSKVKDKQFLEVMKQYCKKVTTETTGKNSTKSRPGQASRRSSRSVEWWSNGFEIVIFYRVLWWEVIKQQGEFILVFIRMKFVRLEKKHFFYLLGMIQKLRNPFLRHFSLGTPPFPLHNFLADQWVVLRRLCNSWTSK